MRNVGVDKRDTLEKFHQATLHFALAQLDAGEMSLQVAPADGSREKFQRNRQDARHRFDQAVHALQTISPRPEERQIGEKVESLRCKLAELGEEFPASSTIAWDQGSGGARPGTAARAMELRRQLQDNLFDFIRSEIELSLTFAKSALDATDQEKRDRNGDNARKGYRTAQHFLTSDLLNEDQRTVLNTELGPLKESIHQMEPHEDQSRAKNNLTKKKSASH